MYYYLVASLPLLAYDAERFWTPEQLLYACRNQLSAPDERLVTAARLQDWGPVHPSCPALEGWRAWELTLRSELAALRAKRRGGESARPLSESPGVPAAQAVARGAFAEADPLAAEEMLDRARWAVLDDLEAGHHFDINNLVVYHLRLQLLRRRSLRQAARGAEGFTASFGQITKPIYGSG